MTDYRDLPPLPKAERDKVKPPEKFSQSILAKWDTCHRSAFLYRKHRGGPQSHAMMRGAAFHYFVEETTKYLIAEGEERIPGEIAKDRMQGIMDAGEIVDVDDLGNRRRTALVLPEYEQDACRLMAYHWAESTLIDPDRVVGIEQMIEMAVGPYIVRGKLDFAEVTENGGLVDDYKTSLSMPSQDEIENGAKGFQLKFYAALLFWGKPEGESLGLGAGLEHVRARLRYPRFLGDEGTLLGREVIFERSDLTDFLATLHGHLDGLTAAFDTGKWQAVDGAHCSECPARQECPLPAALRSFAPIETREQAVETAKLIDFRDADQRRDRKALREWVDQTGEAPFHYNDDYAYDFDVEIRRSVDWDAVNGEPIDPNGSLVKVTRSTPFRRRKRTAEEKAGA